MWLFALGAALVIRKLAARVRDVYTASRTSRSSQGTMNSNEQGMNIETAFDSTNYPQSRLFTADVEMLLLVVETRKMEIDAEIRSLPFKYPFMHSGMGNGALELSQLTLEKEAMITLSERLRLALMQESV